MREAYLLSKSLNKDIYIGMSHKFYLYHICLTYVSMEGSTHVTTPRQFIDDLRVLELGGVGSRSIPNGIGPLLDKKRSPKNFTTNDTTLVTLPPVLHYLLSLHQVPRVGLSDPLQSPLRLHPNHRKSAIPRVRVPLMERRRKRRRSDSSISDFNWKESVLDEFGSRFRTGLVGIFSSPDFVYPRYNVMSYITIRYRYGQA